MFVSYGCLCYVFVRCRYSPGLSLPLARGTCNRLGGWFDVLMDEKSGSLHTWFVLPVSRRYVACFCVLSCVVLVLFFDWSVFFIFVSPIERTLFLASDSVRPHSLPLAVLGSPCVDVAQCCGGALEDRRGSKGRLTAVGHLVGIVWAPSHNEAGQGARGRII